jgi:DNA-binding SARP family transcriptional activator
MMQTPAAQLAICVLGPLKVELNGETLHGFRSAKVRALLAFLVVEAQRSWARSQLADLLWPDLPEKDAQSNLRNALSNLRDITGDRQREIPFLLLSQNTLQFNKDSSSWLDSDQFLNLVALIQPGGQPLSQAPDLESLEQALKLYRGQFLEGLYVPSLPFEEWVLQKSAQFREMTLEVMRRLVQGYQAAGDLQRAEQHARRWLELEPWDEAAHRHLMQILFNQGQRNAALLQYEACRKIILDELGIEPEPATTQLYEQIREGQLGRLPREASAPGRVGLTSWLEILSGGQRHAEERPFFVARRKVLNRLDSELVKTIQKQGRVCFVTGDPGSGKTALLAEFARRAIQAHRDLVVAWGWCNAYTGEADPYFPFLEITHSLCGDIELRLAGGALTLEHATRLWNFAPAVISTLVLDGPQLINRFISAQDLLGIAHTHPDITPEQLSQLQGQIEQYTQRSARKPLEPASFFIEFGKFLWSLSQIKPLVLILDDLHWIDANSANLLFHLGRSLSGSRVLILGAYRPEELALGRGGERHPLDGLVHELQTSLGDIQVDLMESDGVNFVQSLLDSEPNQIGIDFRRMLLRHTEGHPLFTIELLRGMQLRGDIVRNRWGKWVEGRQMNWEALPVRVEAVIAERIGHLPARYQEMLSLASVEGEQFSAEVLSAILGRETPAIIRDLSQELGKQHRLVQAQGRLQIRGKTLSQYRFRHFLYQKYLYQRQDEIERAVWHEKIGLALEEIYAQDLDSYPEMAHQLARHFDLAGLADKAGAYYTESGRFAVRLSAHREAISHFERALQLVKGLPETEARNRQVLGLYLSLGPSLTATRGWATAKLEENYRQAEALCNKIEDHAQLVPALWLLAVYYLGRSEHVLVDPLVKRLYRMAQKLQDPGLLCLANLQVSPFYQGRLGEARQILERASRPIDLDLQRSLAFQYGMAPAVVALAYLGNCLWLMGLSEQASRCIQEAIDFSKELKIPMSICYALGRSCVQGALSGELDQFRYQSEELLKIAKQHGLTNFELGARFYLHWLATQQGTPDARDIEKMSESMDGYQSLGTVLNRTTFLNLFAQSCMRVGLLERGLAALTESIELGQKTGERWLEAEALRLKAELLLQKSEPGTADEYRQIENILQAACELARQQGAMLLELRATTSLCRFWLRQKRGQDGKQMLREILNKFTEGLDSKDLRSAMTVLSEYP